MKTKNRAKLGVHIGIIIWLIISLAPLLIVFSTSLRTVSNATSPIQIFNEFSLESYRIAFERMNFTESFFNSLITTGISVAVVVVISSMAAYPIGRMKTKVSKSLHILFISGLVIPAQMVVITVVQTISGLGIPNTRFTPMIMFITCSLPFSVFLFSGFIKSVPFEVEESAYLDGAGLGKRFFQIVFPLLAPATVSVIITQGIWIWNDFFFPLIFLSRRAYHPLPLAMLGFMGDSQNPTQWSVLFAACVLCAIPLVISFALMQKKFVEGIAAGSVKG